MVCSADEKKDLKNRPGQRDTPEGSLIASLTDLLRGYTWRAPADSAGGVGVSLFDSDCICNGALGVMLPSSRMNNADLLQNVIEAALNCGKLLSFAQGAPAEGYPYINNTRLSASRQHLFFCSEIINCCTANKEKPFAEQQFF